MYTLREARPRLPRINQKNYGRRARAGGEIGGPATSRHKRRIEIVEIAKSLIGHQPDDKRNAQDTRRSQRHEASGM